MNQANAFTKLILDPDQFFANYSDSPSIKGPVLVVSVLVVAAFLRLAPLIYVSLQRNSEIQGLVAAIVVIASLAGALSLYLVWLVYAVVLHVMSAYFDGTGSFRRTAKLTAWGFVPLVFPPLMSAATGVLVATELPVEDAAQFEVLLAAYSGHSYMRVAEAVKIVFLLWAGLLWTFALKHARNISFHQAGIVVSVLVTTSILWEVSQLL